jgi:hypothetical protein
MKRVSENQRARAGGGEEYKSFTFTRKCNVTMKLAVALNLGRSDTVNCANENTLQREEYAAPTVGLSATVMTFV